MEKRINADWKSRVETKRNRRQPLYSELSAMAEKISKKICRFYQGADSSLINADSCHVGSSSSSGISPDSIPINCCSDTLGFRMFTR